ncbi:hypothetical protein HO133_003392 [Letharia lupina]|uniref:uS12 prolyl 3,4-dihydroxylase n=1 Tax=Letharia lupina TaxID=560253 RepID=A0A8H6CB16_9LECA|nr:uncharacterized protein HO133_003392 [Letharia lupina]KAF6220260.1 hypothetical protein HO133_003392 [Letharia lupina]
MKRRSDQVDDLEVAEKGKRRAPSHQDRFREGLFGGSVLDEYRRSYATSKPYRHGVIQSLISPALLRSVRSEIQNLSFTPKETDIYKIHQSGDLANLDGLDDSSLKLLPSLLTLRDAMYSSDFREYLSTVTDSGPLSGKKTDMAINVYTPGCHLLCHDDVIGSRRVSYILYLTDPDTPWKEEWGGALRLYPTQTYTEDDGEVTKVPSPDYSVSIPPAFNQLSFFAVQPGESFHDVQEVYAEDEEIDKEKAGGRARMAISGWYHIPQEGEDGYVEGLEERLADKSSLMQLQGKGDKYELPKSNFELYKKSAESSGDIGLPTPSSQEDPALSEEDLNFLLKYIAPTYLTPDTLESVSGIFAEEFSLCLDTFLSHKFSDSVRDYIESQESQTLPSESTEIEKTTSWAVARPPHKHHFLFQKASSSERRESPLLDLLEDLLPSEAFQKWLSLATGQTVMSHNLLVRRFRRGRDYTLATGYEEHAPRIELCLSITPTSGWGDDENAESEKDTNKEVAVKEKDEAEEIATTADEPSVGGYLAYMAGEDEDDPDHDEGGSDHGVEVPFDMSTGARSTRAANPKKSKQDPAIYQASGDDDEDGVLFSMPAGWNRLGVVLRDKGTMRFVKYVSRMAKGDRWDLVGEFDVLDDESDEEDDEGKVNETGVRSEADDGTHEDEDDDDSDDNHEDSSTEHSD